MSVDLAMKICSCCRLEKPVSDFYADGRCRDGLSSNCKSCQRETARLSARRKRERLVAGEVDPVPVKRCGRCREPLPAPAFAVSAASLDGLQHYCKTCTAADQRERSAAKRIAASPGADTKTCCACELLLPLTDFPKNAGRKDGLNSRCKPCTSRQVRERREIYGRPDSAATSTRQKVTSRQLRRAVLEHYGDGVCACCGEDRFEFLVIDHIAGGGAKHRRALGIRGGPQFVRWLIANGLPDGFRVLCHNCNMAIGAYGLCPHQLETSSGETAEIPAKRREH